MSRVNLRTAGASALLACLLMVISTAPAVASWGFHTSFGNEEHLELPTGVAVDEAGDIYVGNMLADSIAKFDLAAELVQPAPFGGNLDVSGVAVNPVSHNVYSVNDTEQKIEALNPDIGAREHEFEIPGTANVLGRFTVVQIASDAHGNVYVPDAPENKIEVFDEEGNAPTGGVPAEITGSGAQTLKGPEGIAIGPAGNVWVADAGENRIEEFEPDGTFIKEIASPSVQAVALDGTGDVFASIGGAEPHVVEYDASGTAIKEFGQGVVGQRFGIPNGIAFDPAHEIVYVTDNGHVTVQRFVSWTVSTHPPSEVTETQATLHGTVEVESGTSIGTCKFEYGTTTSYGSSVPCSPGGPYTASTPVSATLPGLTAGVDHHYRISATGAGGFTQVGEDRAFGPPAVDSESAEAIVTTATLRAHVTLFMDSESTCKVQYVDESEYAASGYANATAVPCTAPIGDTAGEYDVETDMIEGLRPDNVYHYRFLTTNQVGTLTGPDEAFATFGIVSGSFAFEALGQAGEQVAQAGTHPYALTDTFTLNTSTHRFANGTTDPLAPDANAKDVITELPPGLIGNPDAVSKCQPYDVFRGKCSGATQVGIIKVATANPGHVASTGHLDEFNPVPIYNLVPPKGLAAQFGANVANFAEVHIDARVRTGGDYGVTAEVLNSSAEEGLVVAKVTLWGVPAEESHDPERYCPAPGKLGEEAPCTERGPLTPFLTNPTACTGERAAHMSVDSWQAPSIFVGAEAKMPAITGCGRLDFKPSMVVQPTSTASDSPSGLHVELKVPQNENPNGLAEADLKDAKVTLPAGVTVNPSSASGLVGCSLLTGKEEHPGVTGIDMEDAEAAKCPDASKIGSVELITPLVEHPLHGAVYVAQQDANPFKSLLALYIAIDDPETGVVVKLAGRVQLDERTGQLTTSFDENPQLPFEVLKLSFFSGERASLATPRTCGSYQPTSVLEPFSHQGATGEEGTPDAEPLIQRFSIASGPNGSACGASLFAPSFLAGTVNDRGGSFTPFAMTLSRKDGEQRLSIVSMTMPPGLAGMVSSVPLCKEAQANAGDCPAASRIGHVTVQAGVGGKPITLPEAGRPEDPVYLTERYAGAPFGLSIVVPAQAGPFDLGMVVVRAKLEIDPRTAQVSVVSNPMPTMLQGIPLDVRLVHVDVDRPGFTFNPTNCEPFAVKGAIGSAEGAGAAVSSRFQAVNCATLPFRPGFKVTTHAKHSRRFGAYLRVNVTSSRGQANIKSVRVKLPKLLASRDETLNQACSEKQFAANPAGCPKGSFVGTAVAHTPVLPVPLTGPAIFVSHGGAAFPDLDVVLQGDGVTVDLTGNTNIVKNITISNFKAVPDVPVSSFQLTLPTGPHSALAANGNLCPRTRILAKRVKVRGHVVIRRHRIHTGALLMPTTIVGQNGAVIEKSTKIKVEGCGRARRRSSPTGRKH